MGEFCTKYFVYVKGWILKHIKAPERVKVGLLDLCKKKNVWWTGIALSIKYFWTILKQHGLEYQYNVPQFFLNCFSSPLRIFPTTRESEDKQRPVLVSAHPSPKILPKITLYRKLNTSAPKHATLPPGMANKRHLPYAYKILFWKLASVKLES